jgi:hypothetical protein
MSYERWTRSVSSANRRYRRSAASAQARSGSTRRSVRAQRAALAVEASRPATTLAKNAAPNAPPSGTATTSTGRFVQSAKACTHSSTRVPPPVATIRFASTEPSSM